MGTFDIRKKDILAVMEHINTGLKNMPPNNTSSLTSIIEDMELLIEYVKHQEVCDRFFALVDILKMKE